MTDRLSLGENLESNAADPSLSGYIYDGRPRGRGNAPASPLANAAPMLAEGGGHREDAAKAVNDLRMIHAPLLVR